MRRAYVPLLLILVFGLAFFFARGSLGSRGVGIIACGRVLSYPFRAVFDFFSRVSEMYRAAGEVESLKREVALLKACADVRDWEPVEGEVVFRPVEEWWERIFVAGSFPENSVVLDENGNLVGVVVGSRAGLSEVKLITSSDIVFSGEVGASFGVCVGRGEEVLKMKYLSPKREVFFGEEIETAGIDGIFPPGIKVGKVLRCYKSPDSISYVVEVVPSADLFDLRNVVLLEPKSEERSLENEDR